MKTLIKKEGWRIALVLFYFLLHLCLLYMHESWRDEAYVWVLLKQGSIMDIIREMPLVGHPGLWFLYLMPFARLGFPFAWAGILALLPMSIALWFMLGTKKLPLVFRLLFLSSSVFFYFNPVIVRPYALAVLFMVLLIRFYGERRKKPFRYCVAAVLLAQTHVVFAGFCGGILLELWLCGKEERRKSFKASLLLLAGLLAFVLQLWQWDQTNTTRPLNAGALLAYSNADHIREGLRSVFFYNHGAFRYILLLMSLLVLLLAAADCIRGRGRRSRSCIPAGCGMLWFIALVCFIRPVEHIQMGICYLMLLFFLLADMLQTTARRRSALYGILMGTLLFFTLSTWYYTLREAIKDVREPYSGGKEAAVWIAQTLPEGSVLGLAESQESESVLAYLLDMRPDILYYNMDKNEVYRFYGWLPVDVPDTSQRLERLQDVAGKRAAYLVSGEKLTSAKLREALFESSKTSLWYEDYYIYRIR